jgi:hypothetical protein
MWRKKRMKKVISILAAFMLVFAFAGMASAQALDAYNCFGDPGNLDVCVGPQAEGSCDTFDYDDSASSTYEGDFSTKGYRRAVLAVCDCKDFAAGMTTGTPYAIGMKILVDKHDGNGRVDGNNGIYWAEDIGAGVEVNTYSSQNDACADEDVVSTGIDFLPSVTIGGETVENPFVYRDAEGDETDTLACLGDPEDRAVEFRGGLYVIQSEDVALNASYWNVNIPAMAADNNVFEAGWDVYVQICLYERADTGSICEECGSCCFDLLIGTLCSDSDDTYSGSLLFPYFPASTDFWNGLAITNTGSEEGTATMTLYENGDVFTRTLTVGANKTEAILNFAGFTLSSGTGNGTLTDEPCYVKVETDFPAAGFAMMGNNATGQSMGYLAD